MAKQSKSSSSASLSMSEKMMKFMNSAKESERTKTLSKTTGVKEWIPTGSYILNAGISGSIFKGIPSGRVITFAGLPGCLPYSEQLDIYVFKNEHVVKFYKEKCYREKILEGEKEKNPYKVLLDDSWALEKEFGTLDVKEIENICDNNKKSIEIGELYKKFRNIPFLISTPDGWKEVGHFYKKKPRQIFSFKTESGNVVNCSNDHLLETQDGWKKAEDVGTTDSLYCNTSDGYDFSKIVSMGTNFNHKEPVYDLEVLSMNSRYWNSGGVSNHNTGKTFLSLSIIREAQKMGYIAHIIDTENAIDDEFCKRVGVNTDFVRISKAYTADDVTKAIEETVEMIKSMPEDERPKVIFTLDSISNLSSDAEIRNAKAGEITKQDFTKNKAAGAMMRIVVPYLEEIDAPMIVTTHVYANVTASLYQDPYKISGGSKMEYNSSAIFRLSNAKLDGAIGAKENDKANEEAKKKGVETKKSGVIVTVTPTKNRFAKPIAVKFYIPFYDKINPYQGLEQFVSTDFDTYGIGRGDCLEEKEYEKLSPSIKETCKEFEYDGQKLYFLPKDTARSIVVRHLGGKIPFDRNFWSDKVFTKELLEKLDETFIRPNFELPTLFSEIGGVSEELLDSIE